MPLSSPPTDRPDDRTAPRPPHPVLSGYYGRPDQRASFLLDLFDTAAGYYDRLCSVGSLGSGSWYRGWVLRRAGLRPGMRVLDVATGTGLVARAAAAVVGPRAVVGIDPSAGMLREARKSLAAPLAQGRMEALPFRDGVFDLVSLGYALRHAGDLAVALGECLRVLAPGGRLVVVEISRPRSAGMQRAVRMYLTRVLPLVLRSAHARLLMRYYWDTIDTCVPPETILAVLRETGFVDVHRTVWAGLQSEYLATRPAAAG